MSKQKPAVKAETPADAPSATPDPVVVAAGGENAPPAPDAPGDPALQPGEIGEQSAQANDAPAQSAAAGDPPANDPAPRRARAVMPDADAAAAISGFLADWREDTPAEAAGGSYSPHGRDRFAEQDHSAIPDGLVFSRGWAFMFEDGRFIGAGDISSASPDVFVPKGQFIQLSPA